MERPAPLPVRALDHLPIGEEAVVVRVGGPRAFRRRLMELGLVPGTAVTVRNVAPLGDPLELWVRGARLSIRRSEALQVEVAHPDVTAAEQAAVREGA